MSTPLCRAELSQLVLIDLQTRLFAAMPEDESRSVIRATIVLARAAAALGIPLALTEQYPKGLGGTDAEIREALPESARRFEKTGFSCCEAEGFRPTVEVNGRKQLILLGQETHVCVLQTAFDLQNLGFQVFVVEDGVCSRSPAHKRNALKRMRHAGIGVTNLESVLFEWLTDASHPHFKALSALIR